MAEIPNSNVKHFLCSLPSTYEELKCITSQKNGHTEGIEMLS